MAPRPLHCTDVLARYLTVKTKEGTFLKPTEVGRRTHRHNWALKKETQSQRPYGKTRIIVGRGVSTSRAPATSQGRPRAITPTCPPAWEGGEEEALASPLEAFSPLDIKITFSEISTTQKILQNGLLMFNIKITPSQIELEKYTHILICYKCYKFENHATYQCTSTTPSCSECATHQHTHQQCFSPTKKCLNCNQQHSSDLPIQETGYTRKKIKTKKKETEKKNRTYLDIAKTAIQ
ncbi:hypothetical protein FHG87_012372 [Trinorchestia longiramus]|nr:hypothetical protein FHG87_012372 [Trinorchestia longiramus]